MNVCMYVWYVCMYLSGMASDASLFEEEENSPVSFIRNLVEERNKNDMLALTTLELMQKNIIGSEAYLLTYIHTCIHTLVILIDKSMYVLRITLIYVCMFVCMY